MLSLATGRGPISRIEAGIDGSIVSDDSDKYWYNLKTGQVERGFESPVVDRVGPFDSEEEAAKAPELIRERSRQWAEDDVHEDH